MRFLNLTGLLSVLLFWSIAAFSASASGHTGGPPAITNQPQNRLVSVGEAVTFEVGVQSTTFPTYQWYHGDTKIVGAEEAILTIPEVTLSSAGSYWVKVENAAGPTPSTNAILSIRLVQNFVSMEPGQNGSQTLLGESTADAPPADCVAVNDNTRWLGLEPTVDGVCVVDTVGSEGDTFVQAYTGEDWPHLGFLDCDDDSAPDGIAGKIRFEVKAGRRYFVAVNFQNPDVQEGAIVVNWRFGIAPQITEEPVGGFAAVGTNITLNVVVRAVPPPVYEWFKDGMPLGQTNVTLELTEVQRIDEGIYRVAVSNEFGSDLSQEVTWLVRTIPTLRATAMTTNGFHFVIEGSSGLYEFQFSTNCSLWQTLTITNVPDVGLELIDPQALEFQRRFYRATPR